MAVPAGLAATAALSPGEMAVLPLAAPSAPSADTTRFGPLGLQGWRLGSVSDAEKHFSRCAAKLRALRAGSVQLREELNLLFDQLLSENYKRPFEPGVNIPPEVTNTRSGDVMTRLSLPTLIWI